MMYIIGLFFVGFDLINYLVCGFVGDKKCIFEVYVYYFVEIGFGECEDIVFGYDIGIIYQDIQLVEVGVCFGKQVVDGQLVRDIILDEQGFVFV